MMKAKLCFATAFALLVLSACGGGGSDTPIADDTTVPASALESPESFSRWVGDRPASEDKEPLLTMGVLPPTSDTAEPIDIN